MDIDYLKEVVLMQISSISEEIKHNPNYSLEDLDYKPFIAGNQTILSDNKPWKKLRIDLKITLEDISL